MKELNRILVVAGGVAAAGIVLWISSMSGTRPKTATGPVAPATTPSTSAPTPAVAPVPAVATPTAKFVGRTSCTECHAKEDSEWRNSHHDLAMQEPTAATVRGDFNNTSFTYHDVTTTFSKQGDEFHVRTDGPDGALHDYKVAYTFGVDPLQQYLIEFPGGRYQALNVCWDVRPKEQGGQRWFHLYPGENVKHDDILHWTGPYQNWNHMCAECHSTDVHKNYESAGGSFRTSWSELDVSCEACHGPASGHVEWAHRTGSSRKKSDPADATRGFLARLREEKPAMWIPDPKTGIAKRDIPRTSHAEAEMCARCHSRRGTFNENVLPGRPLADTHRLALLDSTLYEADGQLKDEVYEYGSFLQSRMHAAGVTCTDCHNPHTLKVAPGNNACLRCHDATKFDNKSHHFHEAGKGSACIECHMPTRMYMVVHARHDHSMRVPRPDLTVSLGTPNACNTCHADRTAQWAADEIDKRTAGKPKRPHFGEVLSAGRRGLPQAGQLLVNLLGDLTQPAIVRATAADMLGGPGTTAALVTALNDTSPLVRAAAVGAVNTQNPTELVGWLGPLMNDSVRQVRMDAARRLAAIPESMLTADQKVSRTLAMDEYMAAQALDADRAEAHLNLGSLGAQRGDAATAEKEYRAAILLSPHFPATYVNLGDLYRQLGREDDAVRVLREGLEKTPGSADVPHALGLALVRNGKVDESLPLLGKAAMLAPEVTRYAYVYAVALETVGPPGRGIEVLKRAHERHPGDTDVLSALVSYCARADKRDEAVVFLNKLAALRPDDPEVRTIMQQLKAEQK